MLLVEEPPIHLLDDFCTQAEIALLKEIALIDMQPSVTTPAVDGDSHTPRTSSTGGVPKWAVPWLTARVTETTAWPASHMESIQVTRYRPGERYARHIDAADPIPADWVGGNRVLTVLIYMNDVEQGGGTQFDMVTVLPKAGRAVLFRPSDPRTGVIDQRLAHEALPPIDCEKWVAQVWVRQGPTNCE